MVDAGCDRGGEQWEKLFEHCLRYPQGMMREIDGLFGPLYDCRERWTG